LGDLYQHGLGVTQDYAQAGEWYRKAAEQNNSDAQSNLGELYYDGLGVIQDYLEAYFWFDLAASGPVGHVQEIAARTRDRIAEMLSHAELSKAQSRAAKWLAEHPRQ
jgi:TPR repeat protein